MFYSSPKLYVKVIYHTHTHTIKARSNYKFKHFIVEKNPATNVYGFKVSRKLV